MVRRELKMMRRVKDSEDWVKDDEVRVKDG